MSRMKRRFRRKAMRSPPNICRLHQRADHVGDEEGRGTPRGVFLADYYHPTTRKTRQTKEPGSFWFNLSRERAGHTRLFAFFPNFLLPAGKTPCEFSPESSAIMEETDMKMTTTIAKRGR